MPSLPTITFSGGSSTAHKPAYVAPGVWSIKIPDQSEVIAANSTADVDLHVTVTLPAGYNGILMPYVFSDVPGSTGGRMGPLTVIGDGTSKSLRVSIINPTGSAIAASALTEGGVIGYFTVYKAVECLYAEAGSWDPTPL